MSKRKWEHRLHAAAVLDYILKNPEHHSQEFWYWDAKFGEESSQNFDVNVCGTTLCAAGTAVWLEDGNQGLAKFDNMNWNHKLGNEGAAYAADLLGLTDDEAEELFLFSSDKEAIRVLKRLVNGKKNLFPVS